MDWAAAQSNLGTALRTLGERESGTARLEEAVVAHRRALMQFTRERAPLQWASAQTNLGLALAALAQRTSDRSKLEEAREAIAGAFDLFMQAGQEQHRNYLTDRLRDIDALITSMN